MNRRLPESSEHRILVVAPAWVGDMVMAEPLIRLLGRRDPGAEVHVLAPPATAPLAGRMAGVAGCRVLDVGHGELGLARRLAAARAIRRQGFHQAVVLPNSLKSALVPALARIPVRTGWLGEHRYGLLNDRRRLDEERYPLMVERFLALALEPDAPLPEPRPQPRPRPELTVDRDNQARLLAELNLAPRNALVLCPGAEFGPAKRWPAAHYAAVARHALLEGRPVWLVGSPRDAEVCGRIADLAPGVADLAGRTSLLDAVDLLAAADAVVCNDSGLMHVACAVGTRVVAVFGSTSTEFTPPLGAQAQVLRLALPCSPCFRRECPLGHLRCLNELAPERVIEVL